MCEQRNSVLTLDMIYACKEYITAIIWFTGFFSEGENLLSKFATMKPCILICLSIKDKS